MSKDRSEKLYHPDEDEWVAIQDGLAQAERGEFVPDDEMDAFRKRHTPMRAATLRR